MTEEKELSFEEAYFELETTVHRLEEGNLTLEEAITLYERGMGLARRCQGALDAAQLRVEQIANPQAPVPNLEE
jgi:exodeoxyribonuclease VII small subunit